MRNMQRVMFVVLAVCLFVLPTTAQTTKWTYHADNGAEGLEREEVTIVITQRANGYEVSGEYIMRRSGADSRRCPIRGQYSPNTGRLSARAECPFQSEQIAVSGFKRGNDLQIREPWESVARLEGTKPKPPSGEPTADVSTSILGKWRGTYHNSRGKTGDSSITFQRRNDGKIKGEEDGTPIEEVTVNGNVVSWTYKASSCLTFEGRLTIKEDGKTASGEYKASGCDDPAPYTGTYSDYKKQ